MMEMDDNKKKKYGNCLIEYDQPEGENICDNNKKLVEYIDNEINDEVTKVVDNDDTGLMVETYSPESKMLIVVDEHNNIPDKINYKEIINNIEIKCLTYYFYYI